MLTEIEIETLHEIMRCRTIIDVALEYIALQARTANPPGSWDKEERFFLANKCSCCTVDKPTRRWPNSEMLHGRTLVHVSTAAGIADKMIHAKRYVSLIGKYPTLKKTGQTGVEMLLKLYQELTTQQQLQIFRAKEKAVAKKARSVTKTKLKANANIVTKDIRAEGRAICSV